MSATTGGDSANIDKPDRYANDKLHTHFNALIFLLRVCLQINKDGPTLSDVDPDSTKTRSRSSIMDAITTILVLKHETLAAAPLKRQNKSNPPSQAVVTAANPELPLSDIDSITPPLSPIWPSKEAGILNIAAVPNPDILCAEKGRGGHRLRKIKLPPVNQWPEVKKEPLMYLRTKESLRSKKWDKSNHVDRDWNVLSDHISILCGYLNDYRQSDENEKANLSNYFTKYLVSRCWPKLRRRFLQWPALGLLHQLLAISNFEVETAYNNHGNGKPIYDAKVKRACHILDDYLEKVMEHYPSKDNATHDLQQLKSSEFVYNAASVLEFHHLFCATFFFYARLLASLETTLEYIHKENANKKPDPGKISSPEDIALYLVLISHVLTALIHSSMLREHLHVLAKSGYLKMPVLRNRMVYLDFGKTSKLITSNFGKEPTASRKEGKFDFSINTPSSPGDEAEGGEGGEEDDETLQFCATDPHEVDGETFRRWMKVFVGHFSAKRKLEDYCLTIPSGVAFDVQISLIAVTPTPKKMPSWTFMLALLRQLVRHVPPNYHDTIVEHVKSGIESDPRFRDILSQPDEEKSIYNGVPHCEAVLASMVEYSGLALPDDDQEELRSICQNIDNHSIFVSKLCCPVCWDLMKVIGQNTESLRGRHANLCSVQLPLWLPNPIITQMIERFTTYIYAQLQMMTRKSLKDGTDEYHADAFLESDEAISFSSGESLEYVDPIRPNSSLHLP